MRISDWSSDVCSSDLEVFARMLCADAFGRLENPRAYMFSAARNLLIERARRKARNEIRLYPLDEGRDAPVCPEQAYSIEAADLRRTLRRTILAMPRRSEEHTSELQSLMRISYAVFCLHKKQTQTQR